jgi:hypothetical protein
VKTRSLLGKEASALLLAVIVTLAAFRGGMRQWLLAGEFAAYGLWLFLPWIGNCVYRFRLYVKKHWIARQTRAAAVVVETYESEVIVPQKTRTIGELLLLHVNFRITGYLQSAFPGVTWEWLIEEPEMLAIEGGTGRVKLFGIDEYTHAEITLDKAAKLTCDMLKIMSLSDAPDTETQKPAAEPMNVEAWFSICGKNLITACIAKLDSLGHKKLSIKESGDIFIIQDGREAVGSNRLQQFPAKAHWENLVTALANAGITAAVAGEVIDIMW